MTDTPITPPAPMTEETLLALLDRFPQLSGAGTDNMLLYIGTQDGKVSTMKVKDFATTFTSALLNANDPRHESAMQKYQAFQSSGVFGSRNITVEGIYSGFRKIAVNAANVWKGGKGPKIDPWNNYKNALSVVARFQQASDQIQTQQNVEGFTDAESSQMAWNAFKSAFGRAPSAEEVKAYRASLVAAAAAAPQITTSKMVNGKQVVTSKGGFDAKTWSAGYMSALLPKEKNTADLSGGAGVIQDTVRSLADDYGVQLDDVTVLGKVRDYLNRGFTANEVATDLSPQLVGMAKAKYGDGMSVALDTGSNVKQVVNPFLIKYAKLMEVNPDSLRVGDIADKVVSKTPDGKSRLLTEQEFESQLRQDPAWLKTANAKKESFDLANSVLRVFGLVK